jgi:hypothetical protein
LVGCHLLFACTSPFGHLTDQSRDMGALAAIRGMPRSKQSSGGGQTRRPYRLAPWFYRYRHGRSVGAGDVGVPRCAGWAPGEPSGESLDLGVAALPETGCHNPQPLPGRRHLAATAMMVASIGVVSATTRMFSIHATATNPPGSTPAPHPWTARWPWPWCSGPASTCRASRAASSTPAQSRPRPATGSTPCAATGVGESP